MQGEAELSEYREPFCIGIGFRRCASSWLHACLSEHGDIGKPPSGLHYFSEEDNYLKGKSWYEKELGIFSSKKIVLEFSVSYAFPKVHKTVAKRIFRDYPNVKIFAIVRNPIDRAYSDYLRSTRLLELDNGTTFEMAIEEDPEYLHRGFYGHVLKDYYENYGEDRVQVLFYEDMRKNSNYFFKQLFDFLGVDSIFRLSDHSDKKGSGYEPRSYNYQRIFQKFQSEVSIAFRDKKLGWVLDLVKKTGVRDFLIDLNVKKKRPMSSKTRAYLHDLYKDDIKLLESQVKRDLSFWQ